MKILLRLGFIFCLSITTYAQQLQWALQIDTAYSIPSAIALDDSGNVYTATCDNTGALAWSFDTGNITITKQNSGGSIIWQKSFLGEGKITDMAFYQGNLYLAGVQGDNLQVGTTSLSIPNSLADFSFIISISSGGQINWATQPNWNVHNLMAKICIHNSEIYTVGIKGGFNCVLARFSLSGVEQQAKDFGGLRTLSDLKFDSNGNIYLVGSCGLSASIDGINVPATPPSSSYRNFIVKLDAQWQAQWIKATKYLTFDHTCRVEVINDSINFIHFATASNGSSQLRARVFQYDTSGNFIDSIIAGPSQLFSGFRSAVYQLNAPKLTLLTQQFLNSPVSVHYYNSDLSYYGKDSISGIKLSNLAIGSGHDASVISLASNASVFYHNQLQFVLSPSPYKYSCGNLYFSTKEPICQFAASDSSICKGDTIKFTDLSAGIPSKWKWSFVPDSVMFANGTTASSQHPEVNFMKSGMYSVKLVSANASGKDSIIHNSLITVTEVPKPTIANSGSLLLCRDSGYFYQWYLNGNPIAGAIFQTYIPTLNGSYQVKISQNDCEQVSDAENFQTTTLPDYVLNSWKIFPNPAKSSLFIESSGMAGLSDFKLISGSGQLLISGKLQHGLNEINLNKVRQGIYLLLIEGNDDPISFKVVID